MAVELIQSEEPKEAKDMAAQRASEIFSHLVMIRSNLPRIISELIEAGEKEKALAAMMAWGKGTKPIEAIWREVVGDKAVEVKTVSNTDNDLITAGTAPSYIRTDGRR